jgi:hypothetical protein
MPSALVKNKSERIYVANSETKSKTGISLLRVVDEIDRGFSKAVIPSTRAMLVMFEPIALPTAVSVLPLNDAVAETIISGAEEPIATIVKPIIIGEMPTFLASTDAPNTNLSAPQLRATNQSKK